MSHPFLYADEQLTSEVDFIDAVALVRDIAHDTRNHVLLGEDIQEAYPRPVDPDGASDTKGHGFTHKGGWVPAFVEDGDRFRREGDWNPVDVLLDYVRIDYMARGAKTPLRLTYVVAEQPNNARMRSLTLQMDVRSPTANPMTPAHVEGDAQMWAGLALPFAQRFMPMHDPNTFGWQLAASEPIPVVDPATGGHCRTSVLIRVSADHEDVLNKVNVSGRSGVLLYGPDDKPIRSGR